MKNIKNIIEQKYPPENPNDLWMKDNVLYKSTHKGWTPLTAGGDSSTNGVTSTTWLELKDKRDAGKLTPGALYRITDYQCTTTQENTQSAGHQFDIILLALSENKLAEEGWAMEHPTDVYDVTFDDGVTKKCFIYHTTDEYNDTIINVVDIETKLGLHCGYIEGDSGNLVTIDENAKTASTEEYDSVDLTEENLTYNYFQNSNLSAWKVWYCLDNDKSRFAWADDSLNPSYLGSINYENSVYPDISGSATRDTLSDKTIQDVDYYGWKYIFIYTGDESWFYTTSPNPNAGDKLYTYADRFGPKMYEDTGTLVSSYNPPTSDVPICNGKGVIYRLIDEWNNDVGYDFKNIQHKKNITDGLIDELHQGTDMHIYPFNIWINGECQDATLVGNTLADEVNEVYGVCNNIILNPPHGGGEEPITFLKVGLNTTCFLSTLDGNEYYGLRDSFVDGGCVDCAIENSSFIKLIKCVAVIIIGCDALQLIECTSRKEGLTAGAIYIGDKKVLTES